ncbi:unnamed protein product [Pseudo-nitzschia multistriata]|uniref:Uncharacterized protein n=1 Tax=Pseudo-nitzschia multistriata TaxID=183589 RepID=A0A448ZLX0_9STRA|nr:unnamed protein product [Pseudo-nitzschia multistriata]
MTTMTHVGAFQSRSSPRWTTSLSPPIPMPLGSTRYRCCGVTPTRRSAGRSFPPSATRLRGTPLGRIREAIASTPGLR